MSARRTIAVFGGSFDPPHLAHQMMCLCGLGAGADAVWMLPTYRHAFGKPLAPFADRLRMCELAAAPFGEHVVVDPVEEEVARARGGAGSRTVHTLEHLLARDPDVELRLLIGEDILAERDRWQRWDDICRLAPPIVIGREGAPDDGDPATATPGFRLPAISSTDLRARIARGERPEPLLPRSVMDYIAGRGLYR